MFMQQFNAELTVQSSRTIIAQPLLAFFFFLSVFEASGCHGERTREMSEGNESQEDLYTINETRGLVIQQINVYSLKERVTLCNKQYMIV